MTHCRYVGCKSICESTITLGLIFFIFLNIALSVVSSCAARSYVHIVGSSTVFSLISYSAEEFGRKNRIRVPVVEATGTANGFKLFCSGIGSNNPDIVSASREITAAERELCAKNEVSDILEIKIGYDGIIIANSKEAKQFDFSKKELFLALSSHIANGDFIITKNPNNSWVDVNDSFPEQKIEVYGPSRDSGTYSSIVDMMFVESCMQMKAFRLKYSDKDELRKVCRIIRDDGRFIEVTNDENLIVKKMIRSMQIFGIFGFNFLKNNDSLVQGSRINGIEPTYDNIASGKYILSRPLYLYIKKQNFSEIKWLNGFVAEITNMVAIGRDGYLVPQGLVPLSEADFSLLTAKVKEAL